LLGAAKLGVYLCGLHKRKMLTESTENYLKAILQLEADRPEGVSTSAIAQRLDAQPASVTGMMRKLAEREWVNYERYKGVSLTASGRKHALATVRRHRLWECFLVEKLGFGWDEVHELAEELEHVRSRELTDRLDLFLGQPQTDPHGDPIPDADGKYRKASKRGLLKDAAVGTQALIVGVVDSNDDFLRHLNALQIGLGTVLEVTERFPFDHSLSVVISRTKKQIQLSARAAQNLLWTSA
jgi:DtxR family Mn-dependent transcriptional regulator